MKINKINNNKIKVILTEEELFFDYNVSLEDFNKEDKKGELSKKIIRIINDVSRIENFIVSRNITLEININEMNELTLTINLKENDLYSSLLKNIKIFIENKPDYDIIEMIKKITNKYNLTRSDVNYINMLLIKENKIETTEISPKNKIKKIEKIEKQNKTIKETNIKHIIKLSSINECINFSKIFKLYINNSSLYKVNNDYYLLSIIDNKYNILFKEKIYELGFNLIDNLSEFYLKEHGEIIIENEAVKNLEII